MPGLPMITRGPRLFTKTITFDGTDTYGAYVTAPTITIASVTGRVFIPLVQAFCKTTIVGAGTVELGVTGLTAGIIAQITNATTLAVNEYWNDATPSEVLLAVPNAIQADIQVASDIILTIGTADLTAGAIEFSVLWHPLSTDAILG